MDAQIELHPKNKFYAEALENYLWRAYQLDFPQKDVSTKVFLGRAHQKVQAKIIANEDGILAGIQEAEWFLKKLDIKVIHTKKDGSFIKKGSTVLELSGPAYKLLGAERTLLNLLQRMTGVATKTKKMVMKLPKNIKLLATRKTLWGPLDKRAVVIGGGGTHRLHLEDAILIKENHINLTKNYKKSLKAALKRISKVRFIEVECEMPEEVELFLKNYKNIKKVLKNNQEIIVMLDNFSLRDIKKVVGPLKQSGILIELSGGINEKNISRYNIAGITAISSGALTTQAHNLDMSLTVVADNK